LRNVLLCGEGEGDAIVIGRKANFANTLEGHA
jgi:hypothetical protein